MSYGKLNSIIQRSKTKHVVDEIMESKSCCLHCPFNIKPKGKYPITDELCGKYHRYLENKRVYGGLIYKFDGEKGYIYNCKFFPLPKKSKKKHKNRRRYK